MADEYDYLFKSFVVGDKGVGKSTLISKFAKGFYTEDKKMTIGEDFYVKTISIDTVEEGPITIKLQIWNTEGQERFSSIKPMYYKGSLGGLLIFDLTSHESFVNLPRWIEEIRNNVKSNIPLLLVGNKSDLKDQRAVSIQEITNLSQKFNLYYMETSAKTVEGIGDCFYILACLMVGSEIPDQLISEGLVYDPGQAIPTPSITPPEAKMREDSLAGSLILLKYLLEKKHFALFFKFFPELPEPMKKEFLTQNFPMYLEKLKELKEEAFKKIKEIFEESNKIYRDLNLYYESKEIYKLLMNRNKNEAIPGGNEIK